MDHGGPQECVSWSGNLVEQFSGELEIAPTEIAPEEFVDDGVENGQRTVSEEVGVDGFEGVEGFALWKER